MDKSVKKLLLTISIVLLWTIASPCNARTTLPFVIKGIDGKLLEVVTDKLQSKLKSVKRSDKTSIENFYREAPTDITKTLKIHGYFKAKVIHQPNVFNVDLGPPVRITTIDLKILGEGAKDIRITYNLRNFPLKEGAIFQTNEYNTAKQFLFDLANEYGYIAASLSSKEIQIDLDKNTAKIILHFATGPKYYFGKTYFDAPNFSHSFLKRFLTYKPGENYSSKKIRSLQSSLNNSNFFETAEVKPQITDSKFNAVPIKIKVTPRKSRKYSFGIGFSTDTGPRISLETELRYLTRTGNSFKGSAKANQVQNNIEFHYLIPGPNPSTDLYNISAAAETIDIDKGQSLNTQLGLGYTSVIKKWQQTTKLILQYERYKLFDMPYQSSILLIPNINLSHSKKDHLTKPTKGYRINLNLQGTSKYILSATDFFQAQLDLKYLYSFVTHTQIILHAILGYTAIKEISKLPLSLQFYTGGTQSVRGFNYNTIGPGRNLFVGSIELRQRIFGDWYLATFFDVGNVNDDPFKKPNQGIGVGIVWRTSIGTLELTLAKAISKPGKPKMIQFTMGPEL